MHYRFFMFTKPVDTEEVPDYNMIIKQPMDLETMMTKIDMHCYLCARDFLDDIDLICKNALEYNPDRLVNNILFKSLYFKSLTSNFIYKPMYLNILI